jgi:hypothetical protein
MRLTQRAQSELPKPATGADWLNGAAASSYSPPPRTARAQASNKSSEPDF